MKFPIYACVFLLALVAGLRASDPDARNKTAECAFQNVSPCFSMIPGLAGNFSAQYIQNSTEFKQICKDNVLNNRFSQCILLIPSICRTNYSVKYEVDLIVSFLGKLCTNNSVEQNNFLNSSACYNQYQPRRRNCVRKYATTEQNAKSLCCSSRKTQDCLKNEMKGACIKNSTDFQDNLIDTYSGYTNLLCKQYRCGAASNFLSLASLVLVAVVIRMNWIS